MITTILLVSLLASAVPPDPFSVPDCADGLPSDASPVCRVPDRLTSADVLTLLEGKTERADLTDGVLLLAARSEDEEVRFCCSIQTPLTPRGDGLFADRFRLHRGEEAVIDVVLPSTGEYVVLRGPEARVPPGEDMDEDDVLGTLTEGVLDSQALGERRRYVLYTPPGFDPERAYPVLVLADGDVLSDLAPRFERMVAKGTVLPFVAIGVPSGHGAIVTDDGPATSDAYAYDVRMADYLAGWITAGDPGAARFGQHLRFVSDELLPHALTKAELSRPGRVVVAGWSNGGAFAASAALSRPDVFDAAVPLSEAGRGVTADGPPPPPSAAVPAFLFSVGLYEGPFRLTSSASAAALADAGYPARHCAYAGGHDYSHWTLALTDALAVLFAEEARPTSLPPCPGPAE